LSFLDASDQARELTVLAWRRTLLRWAVIAIVGARVFADQFGTPVVAVALAVVAVAVGLNFVASREFSKVRSGSGVPAPRLPDAVRKVRVRLAVLAVGTAAVALLALVWVLTA